jgi:UDP-N-acetylmuramate dehydrogenase
MTLTLATPFSGLDCVRQDVPLARHTWYRIGGPAKFLAQPAHVDALADVVHRAQTSGIKTYILGLGANLLIRDTGVDGLVIRLVDGEWEQAHIKGDLITVGAGVDLQKLIVKMIRAGKAGIENLAGIPGTIGGAIRMNAGGKFGDIGSVVESVRVMEANGSVRDIQKDDLIFDYRKTNITAPYILSATLRLEDENPDDIMRRCKEVWMYKRNTQPLNSRNCGCIFKNPRGLSAGALIDQTGLKGTRVGNAQVSDKHANFLVAHPGCTSEDVLNLVKLVQEKVHAAKGVQLETEVKVWG